MLQIGEWSSDIMSHLSRYSSFEQSHFRSHTSTRVTQRRLGLLIQTSLGGGEDSQLLSSNLLTLSETLQRNES